MCVRARLHRVAHVGPPVPPYVTGTGEATRECAAQVWNKEATVFVLQPELSESFLTHSQTDGGVWCARGGSGNQEGQHRRA